MSGSPGNSVLNDKLSTLVRQRLAKPRREVNDLINLFWAASPEAYFDQFTIAPVTCRTTKTLECDRWKKCGIPFRKVGGRVLYQKKHVVNWLESHALVSSTSEYHQGGDHV